MILSNVLDIDTWPAHTQTVEPPIRVRYDQRRTIAHGNWEEVGKGVLRRVFLTTAFFVRHTGAPIP